MTYQVFVQKTVETTLTFSAIGFSGTPAFLARTGGTAPFAPFPGATVTTVGSSVRVTIPGGTYYPRYFRLTDSNKKIDGLINWTPAPIDTTIDPEDLNFDVATQAELDAVAASAEAARLKPTNTQTAAYTLVLADMGKAVEVNSATAAAITVPVSTSVAFPVGAVVTVRQAGAGAVSVAPATGVTLVSAGGARRLSAQWAEATLTKRAGDEWVLAGSIAV